jgi:hypothetical protein
MKRTKRTPKTEPPKLTPVELVPPTMQDMADGFKYYAEIITKVLNEYAYRQNTPELGQLYITYRQAIEGWRKLTKQYLKIDLPDLTTLGEGDYYKGLVRFAEWCSKMAKGAWQPLTHKARIIYNKLASLPEGHAMLTGEIQKWYETEYDENSDEDTGRNLDDGTWKKIRKELLPYGLQNKPRVGYFIRK